MELQLEQIRKSFGEKEVLKGCTFRFEKGKFMDCLEEMEREKQRCLTV